MRSGGRPDKPKNGNGLVSGLLVAEDACTPTAARAGVQGERELLDALREAGFTGPAYAQVEVVLAEYGRGLMEALIGTGFIFTRCQVAGYPLLVLPIPVDDREDLVQETVEKALASFKRNGLEAGGWKPELGRSMNGYFAHTLLGQFSNIWKRRVKDQKAQDEHCGPSLDAMPSRREAPGGDRPTSTSGAMRSAGRLPGS